jgi:hypothetical protein
VQLAHAQAIQSLFLGSIAQHAQQVPPEPLTLQKLLDCVYYSVRWISTGSIVLLQGTWLSGQPPRLPSNSPPSNPHKLLPSSMAETSGLFAHYENDYCSKSTEISRKMQALPALTAGER